MQEALQGLRTFGSVVSIINRPNDVEEDVTVSTTRFLVPQGERGSVLPAVFTELR